MALTNSLPLSQMRLVIAAAALGLGAMAVGLLLYLDGRPPAAESTVSDGSPASLTRDMLVRHLERSPRDGRSRVLLARMDFEADRFADAAIGYERALSIDAKVARDPTIWCEYADALGMAQGGSLVGKPRELVMAALALNPGHPKSLEMAGSAAFEAGEYASAARYWRQLLPQLAAGTKERLELAAAIARADELVPATAAKAVTAGVAR